MNFNATREPHRAIHNIIRSSHHPYHELSRSRTLLDAAGKTTAALRRRVGVDLGVLEERVRRAAQ